MIFVVRPCYNGRGVFLRLFPRVGRLSVRGWSKLSQTGGKRLKIEIRIK